MEAFKNLKIGTKLIAAFLLVAGIAAVIGTVGIIKIHQIDEADTKLYEKITVPLGDLADMSIAFQRVRINLRDIIELEDASEKQAALETLQQLRQAISEHSEKFEKTILTDEGRKLFNEFKESRKVYGGHIDQMLALDKAGKD